MELALRALLQGAAAVTALAPADRINWGRHPQQTPYPGIVLNVVDDMEAQTYGGPDGLSQGRVQVDCYGDTYGDAKILSNAVRATLDGHRGGNFRAIFLIATRDYDETDTTDRPFRVSLDFATHWRRT